MQFSTLPILIVVIFGFLWFLTRRIHRLGGINESQRNWLVVLLLILLIWGGYVGYQSSEGFFATEGFLNLLPGYWLPYVPVVIAITLTLLIAPLRHGLRKLVDETPRHWLTGIHCLRILALGTLIKASMGVFPEKFAWFVGGADLLFGLSAIVVTLLVHRGRLSDGFLLVWHLIGALVIVAPVAGLMHVFMQEALFPKLFVFPMVLAPALVVPTFVMLNLLVTWRLLEKWMQRG
ncbi:MAG: hypothetical protein JMN24_00855 [gamma proteobacterium endosymbiont of Lamellibrachia anaximandri]|nr:hypothetical protein [gamma proteobacterium endosymbiont of Lamellibrachia anaximandri]MBL3618609.1 hypothetical protein [gamma proteobacterium endosymbiont of Lamellibrachia anaximandri]